MPPITQDAKLDQILSQQSQLLNKVDRLTNLMDGNPDLGILGMRERMKTVEHQVKEVAGQVDNLSASIDNDKKLTRARIQGVAVGSGIASAGVVTGLVKLFELLAGGAP